MDKIYITIDKGKESYELRRANWPMAQRSKSYRW